MNHRVYNVDKKAKAVGPSKLLGVAGPRCGEPGGGSLLQALGPIAEDIK